jgi:hypothetical protein
MSGTAAIADSFPGIARVAGLEVLVLDDQGRITTGSQFVESADLQ